MMRRVIVRVVIVVLAILAVGIIAFPQYAVPVLRWVVQAVPPATPPPPTISAPHGELPAGAVGLTEYAQTHDSDAQKLAGSGFVLRLPSGEIIGVTTAHSLFDVYPEGTLRTVGLGPNGQSAPLIETDTYYGPPGVPLTGDDVSVDYVLLKLTNPDPAYALDPDPRGAPQPGERVTLYSGLGDGQGGPFGWEGTVFTVGDHAVFVLMDAGVSDPSGMSGSPVVSQYTGKVVGMAMAVIVASRQRWLVGIHPIRHIVQLAQDAKVFPRIEDFRH